MDYKDLHEYQLVSKEHILTHTHCGLFLDMGLGKTVSTLTAINTLMYMDLAINSVLIVAPKRVAENVWPNEIFKWSHLRHLTYSLIAGTEKDRRRALMKKADIHLISRDNIAWLCGLYGGGMLPFDMLIIDELSSFKNAKSIRFKALRAVQSSFKRVVGLTGTPAPNGLIDLWAQLYLLDRGQRLGKFISNYRDEYFRPGKRNGNVVFNYDLLRGSEQKIHEKIADICISMRKEDYLELPDRIDNIVELVLPADIQKRYDEFEEEKVLELMKDNEITAVNAAALSTKLLQFANGAVYDESGVYHEVHDIKIKALEDIMEEANGKPVLLAWTYRHDAERIMKALKKYNPVQMSTKQHIDDWNEGKIQLMMMHPASGSHGLNLQEGGNILVWFGQTWSLELEQQFNARLHRQGQKNVVFNHKLVVKDTIDVDVIGAQNRKASTQNSLMDAVKARIEKYINKTLTK